MKVGLPKQAANEYQARREYPMKSKASTQSPPYAPAGLNWLRALEPRMMFDGAVVATVAEATQHDAAPEADSTGDNQTDTLAAAPAASGDQRQEIVFIDGSVQDHAQLIAGIGEGTEVVLLDGARDGLEQIAQYLDGRSGIDAIHIVSHGSLGQITLGTLTLDQATLSERAATLGAIGRTLTDAGDIFLYGCYVGQTQQGQSFVDEFSRWTGADVAASTDMTSGSQRGGDWDLEYQTGEVLSTLNLATAWSGYAGALVSIPANITIDFSGEGFVESADHGSNVYTKGDIRITYSASNWFQDTDDGQANSPGLFAGAFSGVETITIETISGNEFDFVSFYINAFGGGFASVQGFRDGASTGTQTSGTGFGQANGSFNVTLNNGIFDNVDRVVITSNAGGFFDVFDSFVLNTVPSIAPSLAATGTNPTFTENGSAVDLFSAVTADTNDVGQSFTGATITVSNVSNGAAEVLTIDGTSIGLSNGASGTLSGGGSYSVSVAAGTATVTLSGMTRSNAQMSTLIDGMTYSNSSDNPGSNNRVVTITSISDSGGSNNTAAPNRVSTVTVIAENDAPTLAPANDVTAYTEGGSPAVLSPGITISDPDSTTFQGATVTISDFRAGDVLAVGTPGSFTASYDSNTGVLTLTGPGTLAQLQTALRSVTFSSTSDDPTFGGTDGTRQINFTVTDNGGLSATAVTAQVAITAVNDAPTLSAGPYTWADTNEDTTSAAVTVADLLSSLSASDPDSPSLGLAITASSGNGTWQYSTDGSTWYGVGTVSSGAALLLAPTAQLRFVPDGENGGTATLSFRAWDQSSGSATVGSTRSTADTSSNGGSTAFSSTTAQASLSISSVNDAPVLTPIAPTLNGLTDSQVNWVGQAVSSFASANTSDVDSGALKGIAIIGTSAGYGTWQFSLDAGASWQDMGSVSSSAALLLRSNDRVRFVPDGVNGTTATITYHAWDRTGATIGQQGSKVDASSTGGTSPFSSATDTATLTVTAVNDAPIVTTSGGSAAFVEGDNVVSTPVVIDAGITVVDSDSPLLYGATVQITGNFQSAEDLLGFTGNPATMGDISGSYNSGTGTLTLTSATGASAAQWQAALRSVTYSNSSDTPVTASRTISFVVDDGEASSTAADRTVTVTQTNDAPIVTVPGGISVIEDTASSITGISFSDADAGAGSVTVTLSVPSGSLSATSGGGVTIGGSASALTLSGSISNINAFIAGGNVSFLTALDNTASVTLTASINDNGLSGGAPKSDSATVLLTVSEVNDAPTISAPASINVTEDVPQALTGISFADVDAGASPVTVTLLVPSGTLSATSASGVTVGGSASNLTLTGSLSDINAFIAMGSVTFTTAANATANVVLTVQINDNGNTGSGGAKSDSTTLTLNVSAVNDAPVNSLPDAQNVDQDANLVFSTGNGNPISISDVDAGSSPVRVTLTASNGVLTLGSTAGLSFTSGDGTADASMTFTGTIGDINNALNGLIFSPTAGYNGAASLQITTDDLGASGSGGAQSDTDTLSITVNSLNPRITDVSAVTANGSYKIGDTITITATFNQVVTVDTSGGVPTLLLETGVIDRNATYVSGSGSNTLTFSYVVQAGDINADLDYQSTTALSLNGSTIRGATANDAILTLPSPGTTGSLGANKALVVDGVRPAATSITLSDTALRIGETATVTVTFNEAVLGLDLADFSVANGTLSGLSSSDGGLTWTATFTPSSSITDASNVIVLNNTGIMDLAGNIGSGTTESVNYAIDTQRPTASILVNDTALRAGQSTTVTITFSEAITGLTTADFSVANGALSGLSSSDGGVTWTATLTPNANITDTSNLVTLDNTGVQDLAGNAGVGSTVSNNYAIDTQRPTATILVTDTALKAGQSTTVTITFSEAITGLTTADFSVANGALSNLGSNDGGLTWTATLTPNADVTDSTNLITLDNTGYTDAAGNTGVGTTSSNNYAIDSQRPTATIVVSDTVLSIGESTTVTITFSEPVSGLSIADFNVANGTLNGLSSSDGGVTWTATLTPNSNVTDTSNLVTLDNTGVQDLAGNAGVGSTVSNNYAIDTQRPTATILVTDTALKAGQSTTVTITFSEAITGLTTADFSVANGTLSGLSSSDGGVTWTATLTPNANITDTSNLVTLDNTGVQDLAGNAGVGSTVSNNYAIDTQRPTATILVTDTALKAGQSTTVTITFSEAITGLTTADFSVANGALSNLGSSDGGLTWTATLTPNADVTDSTNLITLDNTGYTDAAGNTGVGTTTSNNYAIDSLAPSVTSVSVPTNGTYGAGQNLDFTVNFSENVTVDTSGGTPRLAITLDTGGTVYANYLSGSGGSALVFRLTVANGQQDSNGIAVGATFDANGATLRDAAGNDAQAALNNVGATAGVLVDAAPPQVTGIALDGASPTQDTTLSFTVTFDENVSGVDLADFALATTGSASGTLLSLVQVDARTYRVTVGGVTGQGTLGLSLAATGSGIVDGVGNALQSDFTTVGYTLGGLNTGDPEFRANPTPSVPTTPNAPIQPGVPSLPPPITISPLLPPPLFDAPTIGSGIPTLGNIFINNGALAPSYIAQVFARSDSGFGNGSGIGFLGFGGGDGGVFGTSSFSSMFSKEVPQDSGEIQLRWGGTLGGGLDAGEILGAPTLGQQLQQIGDSEERQIRDIAWALGQMPLPTPQA
ncbi:Ig-like domain-containing protein [Pseudomonas guguanensis]